VVQARAYGLCLDPAFQSNFWCSLEKPVYFSKPLAAWPKYLLWVTGALDKQSL
jgi:hypothetical protein